VHGELTKGSVSIHAAEFFQDRTEVQCLHRWQKVLNPELIKGPWTQEVCDLFTSLPLKITCACCIYINFLEEDVISTLFSTGR